MAGTLALAATSGWAPPPAGAPPELLLIVYGAEFATYRTPIFLRTLLSTARLRCGSTACSPARRTRRLRARGRGARAAFDVAEDHIRALRVDELPLAIEYLEGIHPLCHQNGYAYLFLKLLAPDLLPDVDHLIVLDPDTVVLADIALLWAQFSRLGRAIFSRWPSTRATATTTGCKTRRTRCTRKAGRGVPHSLGVNGGVILLRAAAARNANFSDLVASVTHHGAALRVAGRLDRYCELAEQDTLNYMLAQRPDLWRPLDCNWSTWRPSAAATAS